VLETEAGGDCAVAGLPDPDLVSAIAAFIVHERGRHRALEQRCGPEPNEISHLTNARACIVSRHLPRNAWER